MKIPIKERWEVLSNIAYIISGIIFIFKGEYLYGPLMILLGLCSGFHHMRIVNWSYILDYGAILTVLSGVIFINSSAIVQLFAIGLGVLSILSVNKQNYKIVIGFMGTLALLSTYIGVSVQQGLIATLVTGVAIVTMFIGDRLNAKREGAFDNLIHGLLWHPISCIGLSLMI